MPPVIDKAKCTGCNLCAEICPLDVFSIRGDGQAPLVEFEEECWHCNACVLDCPAGAIQLRIPLPALMLYKKSAGKATPW